jgi:WD40 repeat protein
MISSSWDKTLRVWDLESREVIARFTGEGALECCAVVPDGRTIVAGEMSGRVHFLRLEGVL